MKNYQQTVRQQRRVKLDKLKHAYALKKKTSWSTEKEQSFKSRLNNNHYWY